MSTVKTQQDDSATTTSSISPASSLDPHSKKKNKRSTFNSGFYTNSASTSSNIALHTLSSTQLHQPQQQHSQPQQQLQQIQPGLKGIPTAPAALLKKKYSTDANGSFGDGGSGSGNAPALGQNGLYSFSASSSTSNVAANNGNGHHRYSSYNKNRYRGNNSKKHGQYHNYHNNPHSLDGSGKVVASFEDAAVQAAGSRLDDGGMANNAHGFKTHKYNKSHSFYHHHPQNLHNNRRFDADGEDFESELTVAGSGALKKAKAAFLQNSNLAVSRVPLPPSTSPTASGAFSEDLRQQLGGVQNPSDAAPAEEADDRQSRFRDNRTRNHYNKSKFQKKHQQQQSEISASSPTSPFSISPSPSRSPVLYASGDEQIDSVYLDSSKKTSKPPTPSSLSSSEATARHHQKSFRERDLSTTPPPPKSVTGKLGVESEDEDNEGNSTVILEKTSPATISSALLSQDKAADAASAAAGGKNKLTSEPAVTSARLKQTKPANSKTGGAVIVDSSTISKRPHNKAPSASSAAMAATKRNSGHGRFALSSSPSLYLDSHQHEFPDDGTTYYPVPGHFDPAAYEYPPGFPHWAPPPPHHHPSGMHPVMMGPPPPHMAGQFVPPPHLQGGPMPPPPHLQGGPIPPPLGFSEEGSEYMYGAGPGAFYGMMPLPPPPPHHLPHSMTGGPPSHQFGPVPPPPHVPMYYPEEELRIEVIEENKADDAEDTKKSSDKAVLGDSKSANTNGKPASSGSKPAPGFMAPHAFGGNHPVPSAMAHLAPPPHQLGAMPLLGAPFGGGPPQGLYEMENAEMSAPSSPRFGGAGDAMGPFITPAFPPPVYY